MDGEVLDLDKNGKNFGSHFCKVFQMGNRQPEGGKDALAIVYRLLLPRQPRSYFQGPIVLLHICLLALILAVRSPPAPLKIHQKLRQNERIVCTDVGGERGVEEEVLYSSMVLTLWELCLWKFPVPKIFLLKEMVRGVWVYECRLFACLLTQRPLMFP